MVPIVDNFQTTTWFLLVMIAWDIVRTIALVWLIDYFRSKRS